MQIPGAGRTGNQLTFPHEKVQPHLEPHLAHLGDQAPWGWEPQAPAALDLDGVSRPETEVPSAGGRRRLFQT